MIYLDASVVVARLYGEDRQPPASMWDRPLVSSRLIEYEVWTRIHGRGIAATHGDEARAILGRVAYLELIGEVLERARQPFPAPLRTLDSLHLASMHFITSQGQPIALASYDQRMLDAARAMGFDVHPLD